MPIAELMVPAVRAASDASARQVAQLMREHAADAVVLVLDEAPVGLLTPRDLALSVVADDLGGEEPARVLASSPVISVAADATAERAQELMDRYGVSRLAVLDGERLAGMLSRDRLAGSTPVAGSI